MAMLESNGQLKDTKHNKGRNDEKVVVERLLVRRGKETLRCGEALCHCKDALCHCKDPLRNSEPVDQSLKGLGYAAAKQPSLLRSEVPF